PVHVSVCCPPRPPGRAVPPSFPTRRSSDLESAPPAPSPRLGQKPRYVISQKGTRTTVSVDGVAIRRLSGASVTFEPAGGLPSLTDRKSTRLNSSHVKISYAVFCLKKKIKND